MLPKKSDNCSKDNMEITKINIIRLVQTSNKIIKPNKMEQKALLEQK